MPAATRKWTKAMRGRWDQLRSGSVRGAVLLLAGSSAAAQLLTALVSPALTRLYTPADFGELSLYVAVLSLAGTIASLRYQMAIPLPDADEVAIRLVEWCFIVLLVSCTVAGVVLVAWEPVTGRTLSSALLARHWWLLPAGLLAAGGFQTATYWGIRKEAYSAIASSRVQQSIAQVGVQLGMGLLSAGPIGLVFGYMSSQAVGIGRLLSSAWRTRRSLPRVGRTRILAAAARYRRFAIFGVPSALMINGAYSLTPLMLVSLYGVEIAGLFALTQRIMGLPMRLLGQAIGQAYMGAAARLIRDDPAALAPLFAKSARRLGQIGILTLVPAALVAPPAFAFFFGEVWREAGVYVQIMTPMFLAQLVVSPLSQTSLLLERQDLEMVGSAIRLVGVVAIFLAAGAAGWSARSVVGAYSLVMAGTYCGFFFFYRWLASEGGNLGTRGGGSDATSG